MTTLVNRDDYFATAMRLLAEHGPSGLRVGRLCDALGVTTGSFYHHFPSMAAFTGELLGHWEREQTQLYAEAMQATGTFPEEVEVMCASVHRLPHRAEAALRAWSHTDPQVGAVQARVDRGRMEALRHLVMRAVDDAERATRLALMGLVMLAGFQMGRDPDDHEELTVLLEEYVGVLRSVTGLAG